MSVKLRKTIGIVGLVCLALILVANDFAQAKTYTITGKFITFGDDNPRRTQDKDVSDYDNATVVVNYERLNDEGETEIVELGSGNFYNGEVVFEGELDQPTEVQISVQAAEDETLTKSALVKPGEYEVTFAYVVHFGVVSDTSNLHLLGSSRQSKDPAKKFTIIGDLSGLNDKLPFASVEIWWKEYVDGERKTRILGSVMAENDTFVLETDIDEAVVAQIFISAVPEDYFLSWVDIVVAPNAEIKIHANASGEDLIATAEHGRHDQLIDSWRQSTEYFAISTARDAAFHEYSVERSTQRLAEAKASKDADNGISSKLNEDAESESTTEADVDISDGENVQKTQPNLQISVLQPAADCEHVAMDELQSNSADPTATLDEPNYKALDRKLNEIRTNALQHIAKNAEDPMNSLLAMELGAFSFETKNRTEAFPVYDKLASLLDADLVARRVSPKRASFFRAIEKKVNDEILVQGQKVPSFALVTLEGVEVSLNDILQENEFVLIDFWASWCGPCIADFPSLKKLHTSYNDDGFEIIAISIDSTFQAWEEGSEEHQLPWVSLGEIEGWNGAISKAYGVSFIPKKYLIDSQGCILKKDLSTSALKEFLASRTETEEN